MKLIFPQPRNRNRAHALMAFLIVCGVVALMLASYLSLVGNQGQLAGRSLSWNLCIPVAEAGIEEALSYLNATRGVGLGSNGWGKSGGVYTKGQALNDGNYTVTFTTNRQPVIEVVGVARSYPGSNLITRRIRATTTNYQGTVGMISKGKITAGGNTLIDSYNSLDPRYSTGGQYDAAKAREYGYLATDSNMSQEMELMDNTKIKGDIGTGAAGVLKISSPAVVGTAAYVANGANAGNYQSGHLSTDVNVDFSPVPVPYAGGSAPPSGGGFTYLLSGSNYKMTDLVLNGTQKMMVTANSKLYVTAAFDMQNSSEVIIAPGATLDLYVGGNTAISGDARVNAAGQPAQFRYWGLPGNEQFYLSGDARLNGVIYAPAAKADLTGTAHFSGSCIAGEVVLGTDIQFHLDEALYGNGFGALYAIDSWQEL